MCAHVCAEVEVGVRLQPNKVAEIARVYEQEDQHRTLENDSVCPTGFGDCALRTYGIWISVRLLGLHTFDSVDQATTSKSTPHSTSNRSRHRHTHTHF